MSGLEIATGVIALIETSVALIGRLRKASERQHELTKVLTDTTGELDKIRNSIRLVRDEDALQTASVTSELIEMEKVANRLVALIKELSKPRGSAHQFAHQLVHGSEDEEKVQNIMREMSRLYEHLALRVQVAHVGLTRKLDEKMVVEMNAVRRMDELLRESFGEGRGLKMAEFLRDRTTQGSLRPMTRLCGNANNEEVDGTVPLSDTDIASLPRDTENEVQSESHRIIVENLTEDQAIQINGAIGSDVWEKLSHIEIRGNLARGDSSQINHGISMEAFSSLLGHRSKNARKEEG